MYTTRAHACTVTSAPISTLTTLSSSGARGCAIFPLDSQRLRYVIGEFDSLVIEKTGKRSSTPPHLFGATLGGEPEAPSHSKLNCVHDASVLTTMKSLCDLTTVWALKRERLQLVIHFEVSRRHLGFFIFVFVVLFFAHPFAAFATYSKVSAFLEDEGRWSLQTHDAI